MVNFMIDSIYQEARDRMKKTVDSLENDLKKVRTGRASLNILDGSGSIITGL